MLKVMFVRIAGIMTLCSYVQTLGTLYCENRNMDRNRTSSAMDVHIPIP